MRCLKDLFLSALISLLLTACTGTSHNELPRSVPEAEGISSEEILKFVDAAEKNIKEMHSFMMLRHGKVIAEGWWDPYGPELKHTMYSLSKSFTSTAVGFAIAEKRLSLNDKLISFFPDQLPDTVSPYLAEMTVRNLLTMTAGQNPDPTFKIRSSDNWVKTFMATPVLEKPGSRYLYNSLATFMLSAIVQKVTGEKVIDYLMPRFFTPLGIENIDWEENAQGINTGGWGLRLKTEDIAKAGQFYLQKGNWKGKQLLPEEWVKEATSFKIEQAPQASQAEKDSSDWMQGYGYQFSLSRHNSYRGDGAYCQYMLVLPGKDAVIALTAEKGGMQPLLNVVWKYLLPAIKDFELPKDRNAESALRKRLASLALYPYEKLSSSPLEKLISGKTFIVDANNLGIKSFSLNFSDSSCHLDIQIDTINQEIIASKGAWTRGESYIPAPNLIPNKIQTGMLPYRIASSYTWENDSVLDLTMRYIETAHSQRLLFRFDQDSVVLFVRNTFTQGRNVPVTKGILSVRKKTHLFSKFSYIRLHLPGMVPFSTFSN